MLELHRRVNPKEVLIGWYSTWMGGANAAADRRAGSSAPSSTGSESHIDDFTLVVHQFFAEVSGQAIRPLHLLVDVSLRQPRINTFAYVTVNNALVKNVLIPFQQLRVSLVAGTEERVGVDTMVRAMLSGREAPSREVSPLGDARDLAPDIEALDGSMRRVKKLLDVVAGYVDEVVAGTRTGDEAIGRAIADTLAAVPSMESESFERSLNRSVQDLLMVTYLANITIAQLKVAERIAALPART